VTRDGGCDCLPDINHTMKKLTYILIFLLICTFLSNGQSVSYSDSLKISVVLDQVLKSLKEASLTDFQKFSTDELYCSLCTINQSPQPVTTFIAREVFYNDFEQNIKKSKVWKRYIESKHISFFKEPIANKRFSDITVYYSIIGINESESGQIGLFFKKINEEYKFAGIEAIP
jgi:hypothetical protein